MISPERPQPSTWRRGLPSGPNVSHPGGMFRYGKSNRCAKERFQTHSRRKWFDISALRELMRREPFKEGD